MIVTLDCNITLGGFALKLAGTIVGAVGGARKDATRGTRALVWSGVALLVLATGVIGYGNMLAA
jgi:L-rhamnose-H+ transport protein